MDQRTNSKFQTFLYFFLKKKKEKKEDNFHARTKKLTNW